MISREHRSWIAAALGAPIANYLTILAVGHIGKAIEKSPLIDQLILPAVFMAGTLLGLGCAKAFGQDSFRSAAFGAVVGCIIGWWALLLTRVFGVGTIWALLLGTPAWVLYGLAMWLGYRLARA